MHVGFITCKYGSRCVGITLLSHLHLVVLLIGVDGRFSNPARANCDFRNRRFGWIPYLIGGRRHLSAELWMQHFPLEAGRDGRILIDVPLSNVVLRYEEAKQIGLPVVVRLIESVRPTDLLPWYKITLHSHQSQKDHFLQDLSRRLKRSKKSVVQCHK